MIGSVDQRAIHISGSIAQHVSHDRTWAIKNGKQNPSTPECRMLGNGIKVDQRFKLELHTNTTHITHVFSSHTYKTPPYKTLPAVDASLRSFVCTFFKPLPSWICSSNPLRSGIPAGGPELATGMLGGGGGPGGGGGGGAPESGMGGGGGGGATGASKEPGIGGGGGGGATGVSLVEGGLAMRPAFAGEPGPEVGLSMAERGRGGAIVPKRMDASCLALPPCGLSSSSLSSSLESRTDQSSSSAGLDRDLLGADTGSGRACCFVRSC